MRRGQLSAGVSGNWLGACAWTALFGFLLAGGCASTASVNEEPQTPATALLEPRQPADAPHDTGAVHQVGEALREEVELFSVLITAASCAREAVGSLSFDRLATCPPAQAAATGFAVFDIVDKKAYLIAPGSLFLFQMEVGFGGSMDLTGLIVGESDGLAIVLPDDYTITPKPSPGVFKGCL